MTVLDAAQTSLRYRLWLALAATAMLSGCAAPGFFQFDKTEKKSTAQTGRASMRSAKASRSTQEPLEGAEARDPDQSLTVQVSTQDSSGRPTNNTPRRPAARLRRLITSNGWNPIPAPVRGDEDTDGPAPIVASHVSMRSLPEEPQSPEPTITRPTTAPSGTILPASYETPAAAASRGAGARPKPANDPARPNRLASDLIAQGPPPPLPMPPPDSQGPSPVTQGKENPPAGDGLIHIPLVGNEPTDNINLTMRNGRVSLVTRNAPVQSVLNLLAQQQGVNLIAADDVIGNISVTLTNVAFEDALGSIVAIAGCTWTQQKNIVLVTKIGGSTKGAPGVQGKVVQVFPLNFVSAPDIESTIKGLLSPVGQIFITQTSTKDQRRTQELVVVEDLPDSVARVAQYVMQVDQPPRQVLIEAHVLQVDLKDDTRHGVDWKYITSIAGRDVAVKTAGFASPLASPAAVFSMSGEHLDLVIEALKTTTDAKTLASPKIIVANGQQARIQIGAKLGYFVTQTTQTSTLQNVNFLNTGVVLNVMPQISNDGHVLMQVKPEISTGKISALGLPETNTTEAETTVLLDDGGGMVIGGLIKESDVDTQDKVPILGDMWLLGRAFQKRSIVRERNEIIIVLIPRIAPYCNPDDRTRDGVEVTRTNIPLFKNGLQPVDRSFEPRLPDAINNPRRFRPSRLGALLDDPSENPPKPLRYYFPTSDEEQTPEGFIPTPPFQGATVLPPPTEMPPPEEAIIEKTLPSGEVIRLHRPVTQSTRHGTRANSRRPSPIQAASYQSTAAGGR